MNPGSDFIINIKVMLLLFSREVILELKSLITFLLYEDKLMGFLIHK